MRTKLTFITFLLPVLLAGCSSNPGQLVFTTYTKTGVDITASGGVPTEAVFGYKRFEGAIIPVNTSKEPSEDNPRIPSVFAAMDVNNSWLSGFCVNQVFATGAAATLAAQGGLIKDLPECNKNDKE